jgi:deoxyadenosine/deoxycytidine kinase
VSARLISLAGLPGSGKTTAATWLAAEMAGQLVLEDYAGNPFLAESYAGKNELRLAGQSWFLLSRVNQLAQARWKADGLVVTDYSFLQDAVYAHIWLAGRDLAAYDALAAQVAPRVHAPDVLIWLEGPLDLLKARIAGRGRDYERYFTDDFLLRLGADYATALARPACPLLRVDIAQRDLKLPPHRRWLIEQIREVL